MSDRFSVFFLCLMFALFAALPASAQKTPQAPGAAVPSSQDEQEPQPAPPKVVLNVEIKDDLLSVEFSNVDFGPAIRAIAEKAGFSIEGSGEVFSRKLNTKFTDIEVERGVIRLLTLVKENNYMLNYDTKGLISKLEIFGIDSAKAPAVTAKQPPRSTPAARQPAPAVSTGSQSGPKPAVSPAPSSSASPALRAPRRALPTPQSRPTRQVTPARPALNPASAAEPQPPASSDETSQEATVDESVPVQEIPYIPPQQSAPVFVPKR